MTAFALVNGRVVLADRVATDLAVVIDDSTIAALRARDSLPSGIPQLDVGAQYVTPGFVDIHVHGALGHSFDEPTDEAYATITRELASHGVTSILATLPTAPISHMRKCLQFARGWSGDGSRVLGVHLEGPYISVSQRGAHDRASIRTPDDGSVDELLADHDVVKLVTYAPELPGAIGLTERLARLGIVPAAGHSDADEEDLRAAIASGLRHVAHIWSCQSTVKRKGPWRRPGLLEASLVFDDLSVEMIADGKHLPLTLMRIAYRCIGPERLCIVSDATSGLGLPEGAQYAMAGTTYDVCDGVGMMLDRTGFAGSTTPLGRMLGVLVRGVGIPLTEAVRMTTLNPARVIGCDRNSGSIEVGKDADLVFLDEDLQCRRTMIGGEWLAAR